MLKEQDIFVRVPDHMKKKLQEIAIKEGESLSGLIRIIIREFLKKEARSNQ